MNKFLNKGDKMKKVQQNKTPEQLKLENIMGYCYGTEHYYKNQLLPFVYTDGVKTFVENAVGGAFWFLTEVMILAKYIKEFASIVLKVENGKADILVDKQNKKHISYTDCPDGEWEFFCEPESKVLMWRGEY